MTVLHATVDDYETGPPARTAPDNINTLLWHASILVSDETVADRYRTDSGGHPLDTTLGHALRDATCAQAAVWAGLQVDPALGGLDTQPVKRSKGIGSARVDYDTSAAGSVTLFRSRQDVVGSLAPVAERILRSAGFLTGQIVSY